LLGAQNVLVDGAIYDVEFKGGSCSGLYSGCDDSSDFSFTTEEAAANAAQSLLDQVFIDDNTVGQLFDTVGGLVNGCANVINPSECWTLTPYAPVIPGGALIYTAVNCTAAGCTLGTDSILKQTSTNINFDTTTNEFSDRFNYAVWSPATNLVPIPAAVWLFGTALIGLAGFSKRKKPA